jgi:hypothetical protein
MLKNFLRKIQGKLTIEFCIVCVIIIASILRAGVYGAPNVSIATNDTRSYVESSQVPLFSSEIMTGRRLLGTNLLYKVMEPKDGYQILVNGSPHTTRRALQPGFDRIVILQLILSILGWGLLAFTVSEYMMNPFMKVLSAITVIVFAFTPQMADWDSILMSESLVFSLFAFQLALMIKISFLTYREQHSKTPFYFTAWAILFFMWTFLRDTNLFAALVTIGMISILLFSARFRKNRNLHKILVFITTVFILGFFTSSNSIRSQVQIINIYNDDLLRSSASIATLKELGMPEPNTEAYNTWFQKNSSKTLIKFMFIHPGYPILKVIKDFPSAFTEIKQTYFKAPEQAQARDLLMTLGNALHPENTTPFLLDLFLLIGLILLGIKNINETSRPWLWLGAWLFLTAGVTLILSILGDTWAINRHALFSTMIYRLFMWVFSIIIIDSALQQKPDQAVQPL